MLQLTLGGTKFLPSNPQYSLLYGPLYDRLHRPVSGMLVCRRVTPISAYVLTFIF